MAAHDPADYAAFVAYLAGRYGSQLAAIEVWNEPDQSNEDYFAGPDKADATRRCCAPPTRRSRRPTRACWCSAARSSARTAPSCARSTRAGIKGYYDGLAVHFYTLTLAAVRAIHEVQLANGDNKPLWLDEFGWSSCFPRKHPAGTGLRHAAIQATNLANTFRALARSSYVAAAVAYKLQDSASEDFGVLTGAGRKPSFAAVASALASPFGRFSPVTLSLRRKGANVLASGSAPVGDYMRLEALRGKALRYRALFTLNRFNGYSMALPAVLGTRGLRVRVFQYWSGLRRPPRRRSVGASGALHRPRRWASPGVGAAERSLARPLRAAHSALRNSATSVSARIFRSRPSDQWAM